MDSETDSNSSENLTDFETDSVTIASSELDSSASSSEEETPLPAKRRRKNQNVPAKVRNTAGSSTNSTANPSTSDRAGPSTSNTLPPNVIAQLATVENFIKTPGLKFSTTCEYSILDFFHLLFDKKMYLKIIEESNKYASKDKKKKNWENITDRELSAFFGMALGFSCKVRVIQLKDIWSSDPSLRNGYFANIMPYQRFRDILSCLHFNDNETMPSIDSKDFDRIYKIRPVIEKCNLNFKAAYQMHKEVAVDEAITKFKGRHSMKQFDASKPIKRGFKWWMCADSFNGYVYHMELYTGKDPSSNTQCLGTRAVKSVVLPYLSKHCHIVFCDTFFSSIELAKELYEHKLYICGTINIKRKGIPKSIVEVYNKKKMKRGESHFVIDKDTGLQFLVWMDKKPIAMITNAYPPSGNDTVIRKNKNGSRETIPCPPAIKMYNKYMGGVDLANQKRNQYCWDRKSVRWPLRTFWHCFDTAVSNAHILYTIYRSAKNLKVLTHLEFRRTLSHMLIDKFCSKKKLALKFHVFPPLGQRSHGKHTLVDLRNHNITVRKRCVVCTKKKVRHETCFGCLECGLVPICNNLQRGCFTFYHTHKIVTSDSVPDVPQISPAVSSQMDLPVL